MRRYKHAPVFLTCVQAKNYAASFKEAVVQLTQSVGAYGDAMHESHKDRLAQIKESLERLYWQSDNLEHEAQGRLRAFLIQGDADAGTTTKAH